MIIRNRRLNFSEAPLPVVRRFSYTGGMVCSTKFLASILLTLGLIHFITIMCPKMGQLHFSYVHTINVRERLDNFKTKIHLISVQLLNICDITRKSISPKESNLDNNNFVYRDCNKLENYPSSLSGIKVYRTNAKEVQSHVMKYCNNRVLPHCNITRHSTRLAINKKIITLKALYDGELNFVQNGGWWQPANCIESATTAIIIPFRNRNHHLRVLLRHLHPFLKQQALHYRIFVVEQDDRNGFNRGKLMNIGFREALKVFPFICFVFHDVDLLPEDNRINYRCKHSPMHLSAAVNKFNYELPYTDIFGGVEMFTAHDFRKTNGFSNLFYTWGGEDDNLLDRVRKVGMNFHRQSLQIARYTMLPHRAVVEANRSVSDRRHTFKLMDVAKKYSLVEGLNSLQYKLNKVQAKGLFTLIKVDLLKRKEKYFGIDL